MNILGHAYVATQTITGNRQLLIIGSLLPESFPFIEGNPFGFEEIHEGGGKLLEFLEKNHPEKRDLALGMLAHSKKYGADGFNQEIEKYAGEKRPQLLREIALASGVSSKIAEYRLHNFLWWGIDAWLLKNQAKFIAEVSRTLKEVDVDEISGILAECFGREKDKAQKLLRILFREIYQQEDLITIEGLARIWARQAAGLPEKDKVDIPLAVKLINECAFILQDDWQKIVRMIKVKVKTGIR